MRARTGRAFGAVAVMTVVTAVACSSNHELGFATTQRRSDARSDGADTVPAAATIDATQRGADAGAEGDGSSGAATVGTAIHRLDAGSDGGFNGAQRPVGCGPTDRYQVSGTGAWNDPVYDRNTGLTWKRGDEQNSSLGTCDGKPHDTAYCCSLGVQPFCNWLGAQQYCTSRGMRLPSKEELLAIAGSNYVSCAFDAWVSWSSSPGNAGFAWVVGGPGGANVADVRYGYHDYGAHCVR